MKKNKEFPQNIEHIKSFFSADLGTLWKRVN